jgi:hypothetical protein
MAGDPGEVALVIIDKGQRGGHPASRTAPLGPGILRPISLDPVDAVARVHQLVAGYAEAFAEACRNGTAQPSKDPRTAANDKAREGRLGSFKAKPDECQAFLRAVDKDLIRIEPDGNFWAHTARRTSQNLHLVGRSGMATALHTEYLIQIGAYAELVLDRGWPPAKLDFECGPFDIEGGEGRVTLAVEAKARVLPPTGDTLTTIRDAFMARQIDPDYPLKPNHLHKWDRLLELSSQGPVWLWLVADGARWSYAARNDGSGLSLAEMADPPRLDLVQSL